MDAEPLQNCECNLSFGIATGIYYFLSFSFATLYVLRHEFICHKMFALTDVGMYYLYSKNK